MSFPARSGNARKLFIPSIAAIFILAFSGCSSNSELDPAEVSNESSVDTGSNTVSDICSNIDQRLRQVRVDDRVDGQFGPIVSLPSFDAPADLYETTWMLALAADGGEVSSSVYDFWENTSHEVRRLSAESASYGADQLAQLVYFGKSNRGQSAEVGNSLKSVANQFLTDNPISGEISDSERYLTRMRLIYSAEREDIYPDSADVEELVDNLKDKGGVNLFNLETIMMVEVHERDIITKEQRIIIESAIEETIRDGITLDELPAIAAASDTDFLKEVRSDLILENMDGVEETVNGWYSISENALPDSQTTYQVRKILGNEENAISLNAFHSTRGGWVRGTQASLADSAVWHRILSKCNLSPSIRDSLSEKFDKDALEAELVNGVSPNAAAYILGVRGEMPSSRIIESLELRYRSSLDNGNYFDSARILSAAKDLKIPTDHWPSAEGVVGDRDIRSFDLIGSHYLKRMDKFPGALPEVPEDLIKATGIASTGDSQVPDIYTTLTLGSLVYEDAPYESFIQEDKVCQISVSEAGECGATMLALGSYVLIEKDPHTWVWW